MSTHHITPSNTKTFLTGSLSVDENYIEKQFSPHGFPLSPDGKLSWGIKIDIDGCKLSTIYIYVNWKYSFFISNLHCIRYLNALSHALKAFILNTSWYELFKCRNDNTRNCSPNSCGRRKRLCHQWSKLFPFAEARKAILFIQIPCRSLSSKEFPQ